MTYCKFVDGKGGVVYDVDTKLVPSGGEHVQLRDEQWRVTRVMIVYTISSDWVVATVEPAS